MAKNIILHTKPINANGPPAINTQKAEIIIIANTKRTTQFFHLKERELSLERYFSLIVMYNTSQVDLLKQMIGILVPF